MRHTVKGRSARRRRSAAGFSLIELMVVVMLVALLAAIAAPSMSTARNDRVAFDYARQTSELFHNARARAAGRGAAHLAVFTTDAGPRGAVFVVEGLDGTALPSGPNPSSGCKGIGQWDEAATYTLGSTLVSDRLLTTNLRTRLIDWLNLNTTETKTATVIEDITMAAYRVNVSTGALSAPLGALVMCTTPNGTTWVGTGATRADAVTDLLNQTEPFKGIVEIDIARHKGGAKVGLTRRVILAGAGAPRIKSE